MSAAAFVPGGDGSTQPDRSADRAPANIEANRDAVGFVYERHAGSVYRYLRGIVGSDAAEDLTQQVFLKLIIHFGRYEPRSGVPFSAWLRRVAHNLAVDHLRSSRPCPVDAIRHLPAPADDGESERAQSLLEALAELPASQRKVVMLRYMAGLSPGEIASTLGRSEDSVHCLHHRARGRLKRELTRRGAAPQTLARAA
jgi:RNA polymerase sigma-70 factor, ECF subfamily